MTTSKLNLPSIARKSDTLWVTRWSAPALATRHAYLEKLICYYARSKLDGTGLINFTRFLTLASEKTSNEPAMKSIWDMNR